MDHDWDFFMLRVDDQPASIFVDLALAQVAPVTDRPMMAYVSVTMRASRPDGLSSNEEYDALVAVETALETQLTGEIGAIYAGRCTTAGHRDFYFYIADPDAFAAAVVHAMVDHAHYQYATGHRGDPAWSAYFNFLYPGARNLQRIHNRRVVSVLEDHGDDTSVPRWIDHRAYLPDQGAVDALRAYLVEHDFTIAAEPEADPESIALDFKRVDCPADIDAVVLPLFELITEIGGEYDGWGCEVESAVPTAE
jgi:uncharacterized protein (TIGR01619 family)